MPPVAPGLSTAEHRRQTVPRSVAIIRGLAVGVRAALRSFRTARAPRISRDRAERLEQWYFDTGVSYYVSARMAYFARAIPVAGNLFHHAVEMLLKGYLCRTLDDRGRWRLKHNLRRTWRRFKDEVRDPSLSRFDETIRAVDGFEQLRYPEKLKSYAMQVQLTGPFSHQEGTHGRRANSFTLAVNDVDELIAMLFAKAGFDPNFYLTRLGPGARCT
jgi:hypothetical protein